MSEKIVLVCDFCNREVRGHSTMTRREPVSVPNGLMHPREVTVTYAVDIKIKGTLLFADDSKKHNCDICSSCFNTFRDAT